MQDFVKIHRKILHWKNVTNPNKFLVFIHLILRACTEDRDFVKRGQVLLSIRKFSEDIGITYQSVRTVLSSLCKSNEIIMESVCVDESKLTQCLTQYLTQNPTHRYTIITICKFDSYQGKSKETNAIPNANANANTNAIKRSKKQDKTPKESFSTLQEEDISCEEVIIEEVETKPSYNHPKPPIELDASAIPRFNQFYDQLVPYVEQYGKELVRAFFEYWTEPLNEGRDKGKKMRFETEKTWALSKRLGTWQRNEEKKYKINHDIHQQQPNNGLTKMEQLHERVGRELVESSIRRHEQERSSQGRFVPPEI